ncbi:hypothetical protein [Haloarchaeobius amylolyticus]|uniref:hypothetical protein n=1 Tax=Haloarchaeobius amylolyticus TaxID=1198296 RepID=UPI0022705536|nr:hypothetical protein [Haloarchaeobius amylolyticus]
MSEHKSESQREPEREGRYEDPVHPRYRFMELEFDSGEAGVIQDVQNEEAWIQSSVFVFPEE